MALPVPDDTRRCHRHLRDDPNNVRCVLLADHDHGCVFWSSEPGYDRHGGVS